MGEGERESHGTTITLYLNEDSYEFSNEYRIKEVLEKYCSFMPVEIYYTNANEVKEEPQPEVVDAEAKTVSEGETAEEAEGEVGEEGTVKTEEPKEKHQRDCNHQQKRHTSKRKQNLPILFSDNHFVHNHKQKQGIAKG